MSRFLDMLTSYCRTYQVSPFDRVRLLACWPFLKLRQFESHSKNKLIAGTSQKILDLLRRMTISHKVQALDGTPVRMDLSFERANFLVFSDTFWLNEYEAPFDLSGIRTFVDIGANIGMASLFFLMHTNKFERGLLVEANPGLIDRIKKTLSAFLRDDKIIISNTCVFSGAGDSIKFHVSPHHTGGHVYDGKPVSEGECIEIKAIRLRQILDRHQFQAADLLKMDIEGAEFEVLRDDPEVFKRFRYLCMEIHGHLEERKKFKERLAALGFKLSGHEQRKAHPIVEIVFGEMDKS